MINIENVTVAFGGKPALRDVSLRFRKGEFVVLLGPSGAGKSTLLRCLTAMVRPSAGRVCTADFGTLDRNAAIRRHRRQTAMIFQQHQLIRRYTALRNVLLGRISAYSTIRSLFPLPQREYGRAVECLDRVGLRHKSLDRVDNLSGGEQQRVGIARALIGDPELILADEPVASLDPAAAHRVLRLLRTICSESGISAVVSLHQPEFATAYADRIVGISQGSVVFDGVPGELSGDGINELYGTSKQNSPAAGHELEEEDDDDNRLRMAEATAKSVHI